MTGGTSEGAAGRALLPVEEYALIGDAHTAALVGRNGSIDWLCLPRFDSGACFAALLGNQEHGFWRIAPTGRVGRVVRRYRGETLVLETEFHTSAGVVRLVDCMPRRSGHASVARLVEGVSGRVPMRMDLVIRFDYGWVVPWMQRAGDHLHGIAGPDSVCLATPAQTRGGNLRTIAEFTVGPGERVPFVLSWHPQFAEGSCGGDAVQAVASTEAWWREWSSHCSYRGPWRDAVVRSLITLKALSYEPTGGLAMIVVMILVMGAAGMGFATPLNLGMAAFVFTITPPMSMLPSLMGLMGIHLPPSAAGPLMAAVRSGHISPMMMHKLGAMLMSMHVPAATAQQMGLLMSGKVTNSTTASLMSVMSPSARAMVMNAMPVSVGHVVAGTILHFAFAGFLGLAFAAVIGAAVWARVPGMRSPAGIMSAGVIGGAIVYVGMRWGLLPPINPLMAFVRRSRSSSPTCCSAWWWGVVLAVAFRRPSVAGALPASR